VSGNDPTFRPVTRQELYDQIRESSKEEVILKGMVEYGFWPAAGTIPQDPADEIRRMGEINRELGAMRTELARLHNVEAMVKAARKKRMEESRERRKETKAKRIQEVKDRAAAWAERKKTDTLHLGEGVSAGLNHHDPDEMRLRAQGLPVLTTPLSLAQAMGIEIGQLRWIAYNRKVSKVSHYKRFSIPKKTGGERIISAPMPRLKAAQHWILENILAKVDVHPAAHGFRAGRSIVSNARPHVGRDVVINQDLKDFFPTITYRRVKGVFRKLGFSESVATHLAVICTEPNITELEMDGTTWYVARGERHLPQGAPTSPAITNILCRRLDKRVQGVADKLGFRYTRYADDLTFSGNGDCQVGKLLGSVRWIMGQEGFTIHPDKTRVMRKGRRHEVTGIIVNQKPGVDRKTLRRFRATLYQIERDGPDGKTWGHSGALFASIAGYANFVAMVDPVKGGRFVAQVKRIIARYS